MLMIAPGVAKPFGYKPLSVVILLGRSWKVMLSVGGVLKKPPSFGIETKSTPNFRLRLTSMMKSTPKKNTRPRNASSPRRSKAA